MIMLSLNTIFKFNISSFTFPKLYRKIFHLNYLIPVNIFKLSSFFVSFPFALVKYREIKNRPK